MSVTWSSEMSNLQERSQDAVGEETLPPPLKAVFFFFFFLNLTKPFHFLSSRVGK